MAPALVLRGRGHFFMRCADELKRRSEKPASSPNPARQWHKSVGYCQRPVLIRLQGNFLSEHDISRDQFARRHKTQTYFRLASIIYLKDVLCCTAIDSVSFSAVATDYFESAFVIKFRSLVR